MVPLGLIELLELALERRAVERVGLELVDELVGVEHVDGEVAEALVLGDVLVFEVILEVGDVRVGVFARLEPVTTTVDLANRCA